MKALVWKEVAEHRIAVFILLGFAAAVGVTEGICGTLVVGDKLRYTGEYAGFSLLVVAVTWPLIGFFFGATAIAEEVQNRTLHTIACYPMSGAKLWLGRFAARGVLILLTCMAMAGAWLVGAAPLFRTLDLLGPGRELAWLPLYFLPFAAGVYCAAFALSFIASNSGLALLSLILLPIGLIAPFYLIYVVVLPLYFGPALGIGAIDGVVLGVCAILCSLLLALPVAALLGFARTPALETWQRAKRGVLFFLPGMAIVVIGSIAVAGVMLRPRPDEVRAVTQVAMAPGGRRVAVVGQAGDHYFEFGPGALWTVNTDSGETHCVARRHAREPVWAAGGRAIAFAWGEIHSELALGGVPPGCRAIWTADPDGRHRRRAAVSDVIPAECTMSPNGEWVAYSSGEDSRDWWRDQRVVSLAHGNARALPGYLAGWSARGDRAYLLTAAGDHSLPPAGAAEWALAEWDPASDASPREIVASIPRDTQALQSPDLRWMALCGSVRDKGGRTVLGRTQIVDLENPQQAPITVDGRPAKWHPRGQTLALLRRPPVQHRGRDTYLAFVDPATGETTAELPPERWQALMLWWSPSGARLAWRVYASGSPSPHIVVATWPELRTRELYLSAEVVGWCSETELVAYRQPNLIWKIDVDSGARTQLFPPRG